MNMPSSRKLLPLLCLVASGLFYSSAASAMGDDDSKTPDCPKGQVYDSKTKTCSVENVAC